MSIEGKVHAVAYAVAYPIAYVMAAWNASIATKDKT